MLELEGILVEEAASVANVLLHIFLFLFLPFSTQCICSLILIRECGTRFERTVWKLQVWTGEWIGNFPDHFISVPPNGRKASGENPSTTAKWTSSIEAVGKWLMHRCIKRHLPVWLTHTCERWSCIYVCVSVWVWVRVCVTVWGRKIRWPNVSSTHGATRILLCLVSGHLTVRTFTWMLEWLIFTFPFFLLFLSLSLSLSRSIRIFLPLLSFWLATLCHRFLDFPRVVAPQTGLWRRMVHLAQGTAATGEGHIIGQMAPSPPHQVKVYLVSSSAHYLPLIIFTGGHFSIQRHSHTHTLQKFTPQQLGIEKE